MILLRRSFPFFILSCLLLAFFLRTYQLDGQSLRGDEAATVLYSALPISDLWELSRVTDPHPPLYYLMLHPWQALMGEEAWLMRFAGVIASVLAVAVLYTLSNRTLRSPQLSLIAAALLAINPLQIWQAQDVRSYPFFTLFGLLSSLALWSALNPHQKVLPDPLLSSPLPSHPPPKASILHAERLRRASTQSVHAERPYFPGSLTSSSPSSPSTFTTTPFF
jgi:uncharacterized membrane protein